ncbi:patatin-like phospholipase, partial [Trifolium medium]|nr:patatin-like phospholipase [Trifolium medium]
SSTAEGRSRDGEKCPLVTPSIHPTLMKLILNRSTLSLSLPASEALVAVSEVIQELNEKIPHFIPVNPNEPIKVVLLSLGCGKSKTQGVDARIAQSFSFNDWTPLIVVGLTNAAADINEYHLASVFPDLPSSENYYLRVEVHE